MVLWTVKVPFWCTFVAPRPEEEPALFAPGSPPPRGCAGGLDGTPPPETSTARTRNAREKRTRFRGFLSARSLAYWTRVGGAGCARHRGGGARARCRPRARRLRVAGGVAGPKQHPHARRAVCSPAALVAAGEVAAATPPPPPPLPPSPPPLLRLKASDPPGPAVNGTRGGNGRSVGAEAATGAAATAAATAAAAAAAASVGSCMEPAPTLLLKSLAGSCPEATWLWAWAWAPAWRPLGLAEATSAAWAPGQRQARRQRLQRRQQRPRQRQRPRP